MLVKVKSLNPLAELPSKTYATDFCWDVKAVSEEEIAPNVWKYGLGIAIQMESLSSNHLYCISARPRSSVWKTGMVLANSVGTIDSDYRGEISLIFYHVLPSLPRYKVGDKIGQIYVSRSPRLEFSFTPDLDNTTRGSGGFGSTGR